MDDARRLGIKKSVLFGVTLGAMMLIMFSMYGLAFWYGSTLIFANEISVGDLLISFFAALIGAFSLGQVRFYDRISSFILLINISYWLNKYFLSVK